MPRVPAVVGVAASAGGVEALQEFARALPADFPLPILVVLHVAPSGPSVLPQILSRCGVLQARHPIGREPLEAGTIFVAPPDRHLVVVEDEVEVLAGPRENGYRPSADALLRSMATTFGDRAAGVVLSGTMDDGAAGLRAIRAVGGMALVQRPDQAIFPSMPEAAIAQANPQFVGSVAEIVAALCRWADKITAGPPPGADGEPRSRTRRPVGVAANKPGSASAVPEVDPDDPEGVLEPFTCPECGGNLWRREELDAERFRCRVGHSFSADALLTGKEEGLEAAMWTAVVALEERREILGRLASRAAGAGHHKRSDRYRAQAADTNELVEFLRTSIGRLTGGPVGGAAPMPEVETGDG